MPPSLHLLGDRDAAFDWITAGYFTLPKTQPHHNVGDPLAPNPNLAGDARRHPFGMARVHRRYSLVDLLIAPLRIHVGLRFTPRRRRHRNGCAPRRSA